MGSFRLLSYANADGQTKPGVGVGDFMFDIQAEMAIHAAGQNVYRTVDEILDDWANAKPLLSKIADNPSTKATKLADATLRQPIQRPGAIYCAAANYYDHAREMGNEIDKSALLPYFFVKASSSIIGPDEEIKLPLAHSEKFDWEVEIAAVVGTAAKDLTLDNALSCLAGYTIMNDLSARDHARRTDWPFGMDWMEHKTFETSAPMGPWIVLAEDVPDIQAVDLKTWISGDLKQNSNAEQMVFSVAEQIVHLTKQLTLKPGDVIATGTCAGVGAASSTFLKPGDDIKMEVEHIGVLTNPVGARD
jgi:2,4-diketo-3-deoxy-L-fuconate hydrolase